MIDNPLPETNAEIARLMRDRLGVGGADQLEAKLRRGGRLLPRALRKHGAFLVEMERLWQNPRLRRTIDPSKVGQAQAALRTHLEAIRRRDRLIGQVLDVLAPLMFNILLIFAALVTWLVMTDRI